MHFIGIYNALRAGVSAVCQTRRGRRGEQITFGRPAHPKFIPMQRCTVLMRATKRLPITGNPNLRIL